MVLRPALCVSLPPYNNAENFDKRIVHHKCIDWLKAGKWDLKEEGDFDEQLQFVRVELLRKYPQIPTTRAFLFSLRWFNFWQFSLVCKHLSNPIWADWLHPQRPEQLQFVFFLFFFFNNFWNTTNCSGRRRAFDVWFKGSWWIKSRYKFNLTTSLRVSSLECHQFSEFFFRYCDLVCFCG